MDILYFSRLPSELKLEAAYFLPYETLKVFCSLEEMKRVCSSPQFWRDKAVKQLGVTALWFDENPRSLTSEERYLELRSADLTNVKTGFGKVHRSNCYKGDEKNYNLKRLLKCAGKKGDVELIDYYLNDLKRFYPTLESWNGTDIRLHYADLLSGLALHGDIKLIEKYLARATEIGLKQITPLYHVISKRAGKTNNLQLINYLIEKNVLELSSLLAGFASAGNIVQFEKFLNASENSIFGSNIHVMILLNNAIKNNRLEFVKYFLNLYPESIKDITIPNSKTGLEMIKYLLHQYQMNLASNPNREKLFSEILKTYTYYEILNYNFDIADYLFTKDIIDARLLQRWLDDLIIRGHYYAVEYLFNKFKNDKKLSELDYKYLIETASGRGYTRIVELLYVYSYLGKIS